MKIIDIRFDHVSKNDGCICDNCGQYITNVYTITYDNGLKLHYGIECYRKLINASNLTRQGTKLLNKIAKNLAFYYEVRAKWEAVDTYENAEAMKLLWYRDYKENEAWEGATFEEYRKFQVHCADVQIEKNKKELTRFKHAKFDPEVIKNMA